MPESEHSLPTRYDRLGDQIDGPVLDAIVVHPVCRGMLSLPGEYHSTDSPAACARGQGIHRPDPDPPTMQTILDNSLTTWLARLKEKAESLAREAGRQPFR